MRSGKWIKPDGDLPGFEFLAFRGCLNRGWDFILPVYRLRVLFDCVLLMGSHFAQHGLIY